MGNKTCGQMGIMVNTEDRDGAPWGMGHMANGTHGQRGIVVNTEYRDGVSLGMGQWATWSMWSCAGSCVTSLILHGSLQKFTAHRY